MTTTTNVVELPATWPDGVRSLVTRGVRHAERLRSGLRTASRWYVREFEDQTESYCRRSLALGLREVRAKARPDLAAEFRSVYLRAVRSAR